MDRTRMWNSELHAKESEIRLAQVAIQSLRGEG